MKQLLVSAAILFLFGATAVNAQVTGGVKLGVNFADLSVSDNAGFEPKMRTGIAVGAFAVVPMDGKVAFQPEFLFSQQGAKAEDGGDRATIKLDFIQIPLLARFGVGNGHPGVAILLGPSIGIRARANIDANGQSSDFSDDVKRADVGLVTGVEVSSGHIGVEGRVLWGLTNLSRNTGTTSDTDSAHSRVTSVFLNLRF